MPSIATSFGKALASKFRPNTKSRQSAYRHFFHEANRLVFCVVYGIRLSSVDLKGNKASVRFESDFIWSGNRHFKSYIEMMLSGAVAIQMNYSGENKEMVKAITEAEKFYHLASHSDHFSPEPFERIVSSCCRNAAVHLENPNIKAATAWVTRHLMQSKGDLYGGSLEQVLAAIREKLS